MNVNRTSSALGEFIKSRRERLQPSNAGIKPLPGRRRTPGLRREEVSYLANVSLTYYTWLEQGREVNPSPEVLLNISNALMLDEDERKYLFRLANLDPASAGVVHHREGSDFSFMQTIVDQMVYPSFVTDEGTDVIAWNRAAKLIIADFGRLPKNERYMLNVLFFSADYREKLVNWEEFVRFSTATLRANLDLYQDHPLYMERLERLKRHSKEFSRFWELYEIKQKRVSTALFRLPGAQMMEFKVHSASIDNNPGMHWCFFVPVPGTGTEENLLRMLEQAETDN
ncbi:helix-turn-helix domain-containing protein [Paenibacillus sp. DXFW5]|uniref:Helix-turn-helix domain-containing protein n=1 Tax=Paenibacillus rhizolycopersici TaxID=2780073 RepID=A0ABS2HDP9_9BACL|nr:helix-turn-helix domain-containing protein [Paenibacillus rhizolycopersici]